MSSLTNILVGIDFTPCSRVALGHALRLAAASGAAVHAVHVLDTLVVLDLEEALSPVQQGIRDGLLRDARDTWAKFTAGLPADKVTFDVFINNRLEGIRLKARDVKADLLVMGAYGERAPDVGVGTVATACVRHVPADVLLVRDTHPGKFTSIAVGVDFSETSLKAVQRAATIARLDGAALHAVHVYDGPWHHLHYKSPTPEAAPEYQKQYTLALRGRLASFLAPVRAANPGLTIHEVLHDARGHRAALTSVAASVNADLLALGTRGRTNLRDVLLGSTAEKALTHSRCAVLAVKPAAT
ncbi:MAG: hypothetical protein HBSAPP03_19760 [Phycisphaerae bacterium]|nr:MAG: hypothetical protein HBSAPP03_19760 [Phycisphaerae bacterium]